MSSELALKMFHRGDHYTVHRVGNHEPPGSAVLFPTQLTSTQPLCAVNTPYRRGGVGNMLDIARLSRCVSTTRGKFCCWLSDFSAIAVPSWPNLRSGDWKTLVLA